MTRCFRDYAAVLRTVHRDHAAPVEKLISDPARIDFVAPQDSILAPIVRGRGA